MPRKAFVADLSEAVMTFERNNVFNFRAGDEDGQINFQYLQSHDGDGTEVTILVPGIHYNYFVTLPAVEHATQFIF